MYFITKILLKTQNRFSRSYHQWEKTELRIQPKKLKLSTVNREVLEITSRYKCNKTTRGNAKKETRLHNQRREGTERSVNLRIQLQCNNVLFLLTQNRLMNPYTNCLKDFQLLDITRTTQYRKMRVIIHTKTVRTR